MKMGSVIKAFILLGIIFVGGCGENVAEQSAVEHLQRAKIYQEQGQYKAANIEYRNAVKKSQKDTSAFVQYAEMLIKMGQYDSALDLLEKAGSDRGESYYLAMVKAYQGKRKYLSAQAIIRDHLTSNGQKVQLIKANNFLGLNELNDARKVFQSILDKDDTNDSAKLGKATVLVRENKVEDSKSLLNSISEGSDVYSRARILLAGISIAEQDLEAAEDTLTNLLSVMKNTDIIEPEKAVVLERLSYVLTRQGRSNEAYIYTKLLAEAFPGASEAREQYQLAVESMKEGNLESSKKTLLSILSDYPSYKAATQLLGIISYLEGDNVSASKYLSESVDPEVANDMARHIYAATNLKMNDPKKVLEILGSNIEKSKSPQTLALYGLAAISDGQLKEGENYLLKALSLDEQNIRIRLVLADFYRSGSLPNKDKEWEQLSAAYKLQSTDIQVLKNVVSYKLRNEGVEKAELFVKGVLRSHPDDYSTNLIAGYFFVNQGNMKAALVSFTKSSEAASEGEELLNAMYPKGRTEVALKIFEGAKQTFSSVIEKFPESIRGYRGLLAAYISDGDSSRGREKLEQYAKRNVQFPAYQVLIQEALAQQNVSRAKSYLENVSLAFPGDKRVDRLGDGIKYVEAMVAVRKNDFDVAREKIADVLTNEPDNMRLLSFMVNLELAAGRVNEAEKVLGQIESINQDQLVVTMLRGDVALAKNDYQIAKGYFEKAWTRVPDNSYAAKLYRVLGVLGDRSAQSEFLGDWLQKIPGSQQALMAQAIAYQQGGDREQAAESYETILKSVPNNVVALNNLGWIYFEQKNARALDILKKAVDLAPQSAAVLDSYGWALVDNNRVVEGITYLEKAHKLAPDMKEIEEHLKQARARQ